MGKIQWLSDIRGEDRETADGKGANLAELWQLGMPVPDGFVVTAPVYAEQADRMGLVEALASGIEQKDWPAVEKTARALFASCSLDEGLARDVRDAYRRMGSPAVAVRSSSTAEDHPGASFAGQHDTALNVRGEEELLRAILDCWASLWNRRGRVPRGDRRPGVRDPCGHGRIGSDEDVEGRGRDHGGRQPRGRGGVIRPKSM